MTDYESDDDYDDDDFESDDYPEDALEEDIDLFVALYREDSQNVALELEYRLANNLDDLIAQLRRIPGEAGVLAMISIAQQVFALIRVRGRNVQLYLSDQVAANDWPIARDIVDTIGAELLDEEDEPTPVGDAAILADAGLPEFELETIALDYAEETTVLLGKIAKRVGFGSQFSQLRK